MKTVVFPMSVDLTFYFVDDAEEGEKTFALVTVGYGLGEFPSTESLIEKIEELSLQFAADGFRPATYEEFVNQRITETVGRTERYAIPRLEDGKVWWDEAKGCQCGQDHAAPDFRTIASDLAELVIFMSGSSDFGREGQAHQGWLKGKPALDRALSAFGGKVEGKPFKPHPTKEETQRARENYHTSPTGFDADGRAED